MSQTNTPKAANSNLRRLIRWFGLAFVLIVIGTVLTVLLTPKRSNPLPLAQAAYLEGNYQEAIQQFTDAIGQNPSNADAFIGRGLAYVQAGQVAAAQGDFQLAHELDANDPRPLFQLGMIAIGNGQYPSAIDYFSQVIALNPNDASAYSNRGYAHQQMTNYLLAIEDFNQAIALDNTVADFYRGLGDAHFALDNTAEALAAYERYIELTENVDNEVFQRVVELRNR